MLGHRSCMQRAAMLLVYLLVFLLYLSASTCDATRQNHHLFFPAARADDATAAAPSPPAIHQYHHHHHHTAEYGMQVLSTDYNNVRYHPAMMMARRGGPAPRLSSAAGVHAAGDIGDAPPRSLSAVQSSGVVEGAPPPPPPAEKQETDDAIEPSPSSLIPSPQPFSDGGVSGGEEGASSSEQETDDDVGIDDYVEAKTHPPSTN